MNLSDTQPTKPKKTLGPIIAVYRGQPLTWQVLFTRFIPASLFVLAPLAYGIWRTQYASSNYGPAAAQAWGFRWYQISALGLISVVWLVLVWVRQSRREIRVHKNGLSIQTRWKKKIGIPWSKISGLAVAKARDNFLGIQLKDQCRAVLFPSVGKSIQLNGGIQQLDELCARIKAKIYPKMKKDLQVSLDAGRNLYFGPVMINRQEIELWGKKIPWEQVTLINVCAGLLVVELKNQRARKIPVGEVPNIELLIQIIQEGVDA